VVARALKNGFAVVAFVYGESDFAPNKNLKVISGDVWNPQEVSDALQGSDAVISVLGSWGTPTKDILTSGMITIIPAMNQHKIRRIVTLTGANAFADGDKQNTFNTLTHLLIRRIAKKILEDGEKHIELLKDSGLDWTVLRSPVMNSHGKPERYVVSNKKPMLWATINRESVARCLVELIIEQSYSNKLPYIKRS